MLKNVLPTTYSITSFYDPERHKILKHGSKPNLARRWIAVGDHRSSTKKPGE
jgi:hypothetical protein